MDQVLWVGKGAVGRVGLLEGEAAQALFADPPQTLPAGPPTCPFHPTFISRSAPASDLAVIEVGPQMSAVSTGLRMAMMASGQQVDVDSVAPDAPKVAAAMEEVRRQYPPHRLTSAAMDPSFVEAMAEQSSQGTASRSSAPGGGGVRTYPPEHLSFLTTTNVILPPPPPQAWAV